MMKLIRFTVMVTVVIYTLCILAIRIDSYEKSDFVADIGIVYGNKVELTGLPSTRLAARLMAARTLYENGQIKKIIVSGGIGIEGFDEARVMKTYLVKQGIPATDIFMDSLGNTSHLTSINAFAQVGNTPSVVAISQRYHISRTKLSLRNAGFRKIYGYAADFNELRDSYGYFREVPAWFKYWLLNL